MYVPQLTSVVGEFGAGKTLLALELAAIACHNYRKKLLVSNFPIDLGYYRRYLLRKKFKWLARRLRVVTVRSISELPNYADCVVVLDEAGIFLNARNWGKVDHAIQVYLSQLRKYNVNLICTYQYPEQVDKLIREFSQLFAVVQALKKYDCKLRAPRLFVRTVYFFNPYKFSLYLSDLSFRCHPLKPRFNALKVWDNFPFLSRLKRLPFYLLSALAVSCSLKARWYFWTDYDLLFASYSSRQILL